ncbi:MAG: hypothetical protein NVS9B4_22440 [Candidatus Acidiferrum sp.]
MPTLMADWKQITARIRRARTAKDPVGQLSSLFEKTRDAMVAFELARHFETAGLNADAAKWYMTAAERFRRADWKTKAQEAALRLGGEVPGAPSIGQLEAEASVPLAPETLKIAPQQTPMESGDLIENGELMEHAATAPELHEVDSVTEEATPTVGETSATVASKGTRNSREISSGNTAEGLKRRRRGRRGGRNRRKTTATSVGAPASLAAEVTSSRRSLPRAVFNDPLESSKESATPEPTSQPTPPRVPHSHSMPHLPIEPLADVGAANVKGRYGDPGLSSRISLLEMQFRRLLTCPPVKLADADHAPVGPGVFVLTDSDLTTYYYVEACQTLRIAVGNLLRGGSSRRGAESLKPQLAEHLGIAESRVPKYLAEHCVVRWLQLDEGASHFAHFVIAVLRPALNE